MSKISIGDVLLPGVAWLIGVLPVKFRDVSGNFNCSHNYLTSLDGCPSRVGGHFNCDGNELSLLKGCPEYVGGSFHCNKNKLLSLQFKSPSIPLGQPFKEISLFPKTYWG